MLLCARSTTGRVLFLRDDTLKKTLLQFNSFSDTQRVPSSPVYLFTHPPRTPSGPAHRSPFDVRLSCQLNHA